MIERLTWSMAVVVLLLATAVGVGDNPARAQEAVAISVSPAAGLDPEGDQVTVARTGVPGGARGAYGVCPRDQQPDQVLTLFARCTALELFVADSPATITLDVSAATHPSCSAAIGCAVAFAGFDDISGPAIDFALAPIEFLAPLFVVSPTTELRPTTLIDVAWAARRAGEIPTDRDIEPPINYVGICVGDAFGEIALSDWECEGFDAGPDAFSGTAVIEAKRFITTGSDGVVDCLTYEYGCFIGYSLSYVDIEEYPEQIEVHRETRPLQFREGISFNGGFPAAPAGVPIPVVADGLDTGAPNGDVGFTMICAQGPGGGFDLVCSSEIGTVQTDFAGSYDGTIAVPPAFTSAGVDYDCTTGRGCLVVLAVIDADLSLVYGTGAWLVAGEF